MSRPKRTKKIKRINLEVSVQTYNSIQLMKKLIDANSMEEVIRRAIDLQKAMYELSSNHTIIVNTPAGERTYVLV